MNENLHTPLGFIIAVNKLLKVRETYHELFIKQSQLWTFIRRFISEIHYLIVCRYD
jgi:uncharacterized protein YueI